MTSERSRVAPATLTAGVGAGIAIGVVVYAVAPLGLSKVATNPRLPGSDVDPLVLLAWIVMLFAPVAAGFVARRRYTQSGSTSAPAGPARQIMAAGLVTSLAGAPGLRSRSNPGQSSECGPSRPGGTGLGRALNTGS